MRAGPLANRLSVVVFLAASVALLSAPAVFAADVGWPREIRTSSGGTIVLYEPQVESLKGDQLKLRAAVSYTKKGASEPVFGAFWATGRLKTDRDAGTATLVSAKVDRVRFPEMTDEQEKKFKALVEGEVPKRPIEMRLDNLKALLAAADREKKTAEELRNEPPKILVEKELAVLVLIDGEPRLEKVENTSLQRVVNSPFVILFDQGARTYFISNGDAWYRASAATGPYQVVAKPTAEVAKVAAQAKKAQAEAEKDEGVTDKPKSDRPPKLVVSTEPAELISFDGEPAYEPVPETNDLLFASNTESNVLKDISSQLTYTLLSGRWFAAKTVDGPWTFVASDKLPAAFAKIPAGSSAGDVRTFVAGTEEAEDAVLDAEIPQTTAVNRASAKVEVKYDGAPKFERIEGTSLQSAQNASVQVLLSKDARYYACDQGVWFVGDAPDGPWEVSTERPPDVDSIPPASPAYNTKYVYIYDSTPEVVYVGYTPGYMGSYVWGPTVVYGTGYHYRPWVGTYYYPRPPTWGLHVGYNPWTGWSYGFGFTAGFFSFSSGWNRYHGGYWGGYGRHHGGWFPPGGYRPPYWGPGYRPGHVRPPYQPGGRPPGWGGGGHRPPGPGARPPGPGGRPPGMRPPSPPNNLYNRRENVKRNAPDRRPPTAATRPAQGNRPGAKEAAGRPPTKDVTARPAPPSRDARPGKPAPSRETLGQPRPARGKSNDVFADREGNVVKRDQNGYQARDKGSWSKTDSSRGLDRDIAARDRAQRSQSVQRPAPKSQPQARPPSRPQGKPQSAPRPSGGGKGDRRG